MKPSKFNLLSRSESEPSKVLLYNTLHDHRILFEDPECDPEVLFEKVKTRMPLSEREREAATQLYEMGVLLDDATDEQALFEQWYFEKIQNRKDLMQVTILPTMNCNLACDYCFENGVRENGLMSPKTIENTIAWISSRLHEVRPKALHLVFFGGEPLLHPQAIRQIMRSLWDVTQSLKITQDVGMITNGVLLKPEFVDELKPYGWKWIKITFDGDREQHDKKRIRHNRQGTFDQIYDNLSLIKGKLKINIGGNFDNENYESMFSLVERLRQSPFAEDIVSARFKPIMASNPDLASGRQGKVTPFCEVCSFNDQQTKAILDLQDKVVEGGLPLPEKPEIGPCEFHTTHSVTIGPDGSIYKCPAFVGLTNLRAGSVESAEFNESGKHQIAFKKWDEDCESCSYLPVCSGGCRYNSLNKTGTFEVRSCEGKFLAKATQDFMQKEIVRLSAL